MLLGAEHGEDGMHASAGTASLQGEGAAAAVRRVPYRGAEGGAAGGSLGSTLLPGTGSGAFRLPSGVRGAALENVQYEHLEFGKLLGAAPLPPPSPPPPPLYMHAPPLL